jgi:hypothetical protein
MIFTIDLAVLLYFTDNIIYRIELTSHAPQAPCVFLVLKYGYADLLLHNGCYSYRSDRVDNHQLSILDLKHRLTRHTN